jgi:anti-sigma B factor antagonist
VSPHPFDVSLDDRGHVVVVHVRGEVDTATAPEMGNAINGQLERGRQIVLDLSEVEFMDLHGLAVVMRAARRDRKAFAVARPSPCVQRLFELVHVDGEVRILSDERRPLDAA